MDVIMKSGFFSSRTFFLLQGFIRYVGQSGEQDAREKEMEENMNEVLNTFVHIMEQQ